MNDNISRPDRVTAAALLSGLALTAVVVWLLAATAADRDREEFQAAARQAQAAILAKVETSVALLRATAGLFASHGEAVTVSSFRAYVGRLALRERYPGLLGIGFSQRLEPDGAEALAAEMRRQGHESFRVWPEVAGERHSIVFLEPLDTRNRAAIGYDMFSNPVRRAAMERARDRAVVSASGIVELVQEIDRQKQPGFLIYLPVYAGEAVPPPQERAAKLRGFAYSPIRAVDFLSAAFAYESQPSVGVSVYHGEPAPASLLYSRGRRAGSRFTSTSQVEVLGQPWTFVFESRTTHADSLVMPAAVGVAGTLLSLLLAVLVRRERRSRSLLQRSLEAERAARAQVEKVNRMKDEFLAMLSHELRTPLHAIIGWASLLKEKGLTEDRRRSGVDVIERNARAQSRMIDDLLDMNRVISGKLALDLETIRPAAVLADALRSLGPEAQRKAIQVSTFVPDENIVVRADPARLQQVVSNLVGNAIKFTPQGGRVDVSLEAHGGRMRLRVADTGEGIEEEFLQRIFNRFAQADSSITRRHGGLGLGLAISRELVEMHGGTIHASSPGKGKGAVFTVELDLAEAEQPAGDASPAAAPAAILQGARVLAVDDDADAREFMRSVLSGCGAEVRVAESAEEALRILAEWRPDALVSDIGMPVVDGYGLIGRVRALPEGAGRRTPAAALTAYARESDRQVALDAGFDLHLAKPLDRDTLIQAVGRLLAEGRAGEAGAPQAAPQP